MNRRCCKRGAGSGACVGQTLLSTAFEFAFDRCRSSTFKIAAVKDRAAGGSLKPSRPPGPTYLPLLHLAPFLSRFKSPAAQAGSAKLPVGTLPFKRNRHRKRHNQPVIPLADSPTRPMRESSK